MDWYEYLERVCIMRNIPNHDLLKYLDRLPAQPEERKQEMSRQFAEEIRDRYPVRKRKIHLLQPSDLGSFPGDKKLAEAMKAGRLAEAEEAEEEAEEDEQEDYIPCPREELDRYIEYLVEIFGYERRKTDLLEAYATLEVEADGNPDMPDGIEIIEFIEAWDEYIEKNPVREKVMFTWDQFLGLPKTDQADTVFFWEMEYAEHKSIHIAFAYGDNEPDLFRYAEMFNWLREYGSPHARELEAGDEMLEEYCGTGHVSHCPVCGGDWVLAFGHAFSDAGSLTLICPKCGMIGYHFGAGTIHVNSDKRTIKTMKSKC